MAKGQKTTKRTQSFWTNFVLILICVIWMVPVIGILITSFRPSEDIFKTGWWTVFPHKEDIEIDRVVLPEDVDVNGPITYGGKTAMFEEWQRGIELDDGTKATWYGNKRTRTLVISKNNGLDLQRN